MWLGSGIAVTMAVAELAATALIGPLAWEPPYATGADLRRQQDQKKSNNNICIYIYTYAHTLYILPEFKIHKCTFIFHFFFR